MARDPSYQKFFNGGSVTLSTENTDPQLQEALHIVEDMIQPDERDDLDTRYLVTMQQHTRHGQEIQDEIREHFGDKVFKTVIRRSIRFADSTIAGEPLLLFDKDHKGAQAYRELAQEIRSHGEANVLTGQG